MRIKDLYLSFLNENTKDFFYLDESSVKDVSDVSLSKDDNYIRIDFTTTYGKPMSVAANYDDFVKWYSKNKEKDQRPESLFKKYRGCGYSKIQNRKNSSFGGPFNS